MLVSYRLGFKNLFNYLFFIFRSLTIIGLKIIFVASSKRKLPPTSTNIIYSAVVCPPAHCAIVGIKNKIQPTKNTPVLTKGHTIADRTTAKVLLYFCNTLYVAPAKIPQSIPLAITVSTVPKGFTTKNAVASPFNNTTAPKTKPSHPPILYPQVDAPITMGTSTREIENGPNLINAPINCSIITKAVSTAVKTSDCVDIFFCVFIKILLAVVR